MNMLTKTHNVGLSMSYWVGLTRSSRNAKVEETRVYDGLS